MRLRSLLPRRLAALLASLALVSVTARPVLACDMGHEGHGDAARAESADPHVGHHMAADPSAADATSEPVAQAAPLGTPAPTPTSPACDHVVGCAVMVLSSNQTIAPASASVVDSAPRTTDADVDAPTLAVEPPPPRR